MVNCIPHSHSEFRIPHSRLVRLSVGHQFLKLERWVQFSYESLYWLNNLLRFAVMVLATWLSIRCPRTRGFNSRPECFVFWNWDTLQFPNTSFWLNGGIGIHATFKKSSFRGWEFESLFGHFASLTLGKSKGQPSKMRFNSCRRAGSQLAFIWPNRSVQFRSLQLFKFLRFEIQKCERVGTLFPTRVLFQR